VWTNFFLIMFFKSGINTSLTNLLICSFLSKKEKRKLHIFQMFSDTKGCTERHKNLSEMVREDLGYVHGEVLGHHRGVQGHQGVHGATLSFFRSLSLFHPLSLLLHTHFLSLSLAISLCLSFSLYCCLSLLSLYLPISLVVWFNADDSWLLACIQLMNGKFVSRFNI
jgi:hypothetical protein